VTRRLAIIAAIAVALIVVGFGIALGVGWLNAKDSPPDQAILRHRVDLLESDAFLGALLAADHATQSITERLTCQPPTQWNLRAITRGNLDTAQVARELQQPEAFGWQATGPSTYHRTIAPGVTATLQATVSGDQATFTLNASAGLTCHRASS
jgi:hypothetical protein